jgi:manganese/zinc/iron transport system permease protein
MRNGQPWQQEIEAMGEQISAETRRVWLLIAAITATTLLFLPFSQVALGVRYDHTLRTVALGGSLLGMLSGVLGSFATLRRESLLGDALSHAALPGVAIAFLIAGRQLPALLIGAAVAGWLGVAFIALLTRTTRLKQDAAMGIVLVSWFAAGIALLVWIQGRPDAGQAGLGSFIFGQAAAIVQGDVWLIAAISVVALGVLALFWRQFKLISFDPEFARAVGLPVDRLALLLSTLIVAAIVPGLQLAGVVLMVGMVIAPGIAARQWTNQLFEMVVLAGVLGAFAGGTGAILSAAGTRLPTGPMIIVVSFLVVLFSLALAPERGLVWRWVRERRDRPIFAARTVLRDLFHYAFDHGSPITPVPEKFLLGVSGRVARQGLRLLEHQGHVRRVGDQWQLTAEGVTVASRDARNVLLWDIYREDGYDLGLPLIAEDRQREIGELLSADAIARLEQRLSERLT